MGVELFMLTRWQLFHLMIIGQGVFLYLVFCTHFSLSVILVCIQVICIVSALPWYRIFLSRLFCNETILGLEFVFWNKVWVAAPLVVAVIYVWELSQLRREPNTRRDSCSICIWTPVPFIWEKKNFNNCSLVCFGDSLTEIWVHTCFFGFCQKAQGSPDCGCEFEPVCLNTTRLRIYLGALRFTMFFPSRRSQTWQCDTVHVFAKTNKSACALCNWLTCLIDTPGRVPHTWQVRGALLSSSSQQWWAVLLNAGRAW